MIPHPIKFFGFLYFIQQLILIIIFPNQTIFAQHSLTFFGVINIYTIIFMNENSNLNIIYKNNLINSVFRLK